MKDCKGYSRAGSFEQWVNLVQSHCSSAMLLSINKFTCQSLVNCEIAKASSKGQSIVNVWILQGSVRTFDHPISVYHFPTFPERAIWALSPVGCDVHRWAPDPRPWPIQTSVEDSGLVQGLFSWLWNEWSRAANLLKPSGLKHIWTLSALYWCFFLRLRIWL